MKKITIFVISLLLSQLSFSQIIDSFGIKFGISYSNIDYNLKNVDFSTPTDYKPGIVFSIYGKKSLSKNIEFISEVGYSQKGYQEDFFRTDESGINIGITTYKNNFNYLTLQAYPRIIINYNLIQPYLLVGPKIDILLSSEFDFDLFDHSEFMNNSQIGIVYGLGAKLDKLVHLPLLIELTSFYDFVDYAENEGFYSKNLSYQLKLGFEL